MTEHIEGATPSIDIYADAEEVEKVAASAALSLLRKASDGGETGQESSDRLIHWVLTGGGVGIGTLRRIAEHPDLESVDWGRVHVWWGDERFLMAGDEERNETQARQALLDQLVGEGLLPEGNIHPMPALGATVAIGADPDAEDMLAAGLEIQVMDPGDAAAAYDEELAKYAGPTDDIPEFALLMLGMGPDGHVASLFPGNPGVEVTGTATTGVWESPKPPPERVSLTFEAIRSAREVWLLATGANKAPAIATAMTGVHETEIPAVGARGRHKTRWFLDQASAYLADGA